MTMMSLKVRCSAVREMIFFSWRLASFTESFGGRYTHTAITDMGGGDDDDDDDDDDEDGDREAERKSLQARMKSSL